MKPLLVLSLCLALVACASKPRVYHAPDTSKLDASAERLHKAVSSARDLHKQVQASTTDAKGKLAELSTHIESLGGKIATLEKAAPFELHDQIESARMEIDGMRINASDLTMKLNSMLSLESTEGQRLEEANAADKDVQQFKAEYVASAEAQTQQLNAESIARANAENEARALKQKNWIRRALEAVAGLAILAAGVLWFTGKLTLTTAAAAAKTALL